MDGRGFLQQLLLAAASAEEPPPPRNPLDELIEAAMKKSLSEIAARAEAGNATPDDELALRFLLDRVALNPTPHTGVAFGKY